MSASAAPAAIRLLQLNQEGACRELLGRRECVSPTRSMQHFVLAYCPASDLCWGELRYSKGFDLTCTSAMPCGVIDRLRSTIALTTSKYCHNHTVLPCMPVKRFCSERFPQTIFCDHRMLHSTGCYGRSVRYPCRKLNLPAGTTKKRLRTLA